MHMSCFYRKPGQAGYSGRRSNSTDESARTARGCLSPFERMWRAAHIAKEKVDRKVGNQRNLNEHRYLAREMPARSSVTIPTPSAYAETFSPSA
jgi:hypothetical protein